MSRPWISEQTQATVRQRAKGLCEYCHASEQWQYVQFTIDHIVPLAEGGSSDLNNLALACFHCNRRKGRAQDAIDPQSEQKVNLFHPRQDRWLDHFRWSERLFTDYWHYSHWTGNGCSTSDEPGTHCDHSSRRLRNWATSTIGR